MFVFSEPRFLWLLPFAVIPPVLHLLSRRRPPALPFPTTRFLLHSPHSQKQRTRWQELLLMLLRTLCIVLFALALANPRWLPRPEGADAAQCPPAVAILVDSSCSMHSCAEAARAEVQSALEEHRGWECLLLPFARQATPLAPAELSDWRPGYEEAFPAAALQQACQWLANFQNNTHKLLIISDLQQSNWNHVLPEVPAGTQVEFRLGAIDAHDRVNASITAVQASPLSETQLRLRVEWRNWSDQPQERTLRLQIGGHAVEQALSLPPHSTGATAMSADWTAEASRGLATLLPADDFPLDDSYYFWAQHEPPTPILLLLPDLPEDTQVANELEFFLTRAFTAERAEAPGHFSVTSLGASSLPLVELANYAMIVLAGSAERLSENDLGTLRSFLSAGGTLLLIPGSAPVSAWRFLQQGGLLAAEEHGVSRQLTGLAKVPEKTLLSRLFPSHAPSDLNLFSIKQLLRVSPSDATAILLQSLDRQSALLRETPSAGGAIYAFTFPFHHEATDFPLTQSFLPILREIAAEGTSGHSETLRLHCGEEVPVLHDLDGAPLPLELLPDTSRPGLARLGSHPVEINLPPAESTPHSADRDEILRVLTTHSQNNAAPADGLALATEKPPCEMRSWCYGLLAALLVAEGLLALPAARPRRDSEEHIFHTLWH